MNISNKLITLMMLSIFLFSVSAKNVNAEVSSYKVKSEMKKNFNGQIYQYENGEGEEGDVVEEEEEYNE